MHLDFSDMNRVKQWMLKMENEVPGYESVHQGYEAMINKSKQIMSKL